MTRHTAAGWALIAGTIAGLLTMAFHTTGGDMIANATGGGHNVMTIGTHALAIAAQPVLLAGLLALTMLLARQQEILSVAAYICYAVGAVAVLIAAVASGLISPSLSANLVGADEALTQVIRSQIHYTGTINQAFAKVNVMMSCTAIVLWSIAMLRSGVFGRVVAGWGLVTGVALMVGVASGHLTLGIHGFGAVVLSQGIWLVATGIKLRAIPQAPPIS